MKKAMIIWTNIMKWADTRGNQAWLTTCQKNNNNKKKPKTMVYDSKHLSTSIWEEWKGLIVLFKVIAISNIKYTVPVCKGLSEL